jgi:putative two-component system response regulator
VSSPNLTKKGIIMKILIVDDIEANLYLLETILNSNGYEVVTAKNGAEALKKLKKDSADMIISDILMPKMDGFQFCRACKKDEKLKNIPFLFYTATYTERKDEQFALSLGAAKFIIKPQDPDILIKIIKDVIKEHQGKATVELKKKKDDEVTYLSEYRKRIVKKLEKKVEDLNREIVIRKQAEEEQRKSYAKLEKTLDNTISALASMLENKDYYTSEHQKRVKVLVIAISKELGLDGDMVKAIGTAALVHDIGKISIPTSILSKPGKISDIEFDMIKTHPETSYNILKEIEFAYPIAKIVLQHHERLNGSGYPYKLKDKDILLAAKILSVADVVEAMSSFRPYRPALGINKALEEIMKNKDILYDTKVVLACLNVFKKGKFKF